ncbi:nucleosome assembly protein 1-like 1 [Culicoides brevitarsis]|uniref:nucleosome assembly protein 1-like 1 n=1 Tax=Culicoides brevitarsis TaxID=469753 RepID=UPI00307B80A5
MAENSVLPKPLDLQESLKDEDISLSEFMSPANFKSHQLQFMHRYLNAIMKKRDHEKFLQELPADIHKKLLALKKLQLETMDLSAEFHMKVHELEKEYLAKHDSIFEKRSQIVSGDHVPEPSDDAKIHGIPDFWLTIFKLVPQMDQMVQPHDEPILKYLKDVRIRSETDPCLSFTLEFHFAPNDFFENSVLTKEYFMKCAPEATTPFAFDGPEIFKSRGTEILWKEKSKNVTIGMREVEGTETEVKVQSFFNFFSPPEVIEDPNHPFFHEVNAILEADFEIGFCLKDRVVPRAVLYFTAEVKDDDDAASSDSEMSNLQVVYEHSEDEKQGDGDKPSEA